MRAEIEERIKQLAEAEKQHMANYNAAYGARSELERLLKIMDERKGEGATETEQRGIKAIASKTA